MILITKIYVNFSILSLITIVVITMHILTCQLVIFVGLYRTTSYIVRFILFISFSFKATFLPFNKVIMFSNFLF